MAVAALVGGILCGLTDFGSSVTGFLVGHRDIILYLLMFLVGIGIGMHHGLIKKIREYHVRILIIPAGIVVGSICRRNGLRSADRNSDECEYGRLPAGLDGTVSQGLLLKTWRGRRWEVLRSSAI